MNDDGGGGDVAPPAARRSSEHERIRELRKLFATGTLPPGVRLGIGDDAAILEPSTDPIVVSVDAHVEGVHFTRALMSLEDAGYRATMAALSDLAAMGADPLGVVASVTLPRSTSDAELFAIARGQRDAAARCATAIIGGNLTRGEAISIATTVLGKAARPVARSGAKPGDTIWVGGPLGLASAGLQFLSRNCEPRSAAEHAAVLAFRRPLAQIALGKIAAGAGATAMIDVSDGLAADLGHVAIESGVEVVIDETSLADAHLAEIARTLGVSAEELALHGGEDFAVVACIPGPSRPEGMRRIGECRAPASAGASPAVLVRYASGEVRPLAPRGFDHFGSGA